MPLAAYHRKRDFRKTAEPPGDKTGTRRAALFVIQKHAASRLHYDFRLELDGVLKSWAVPKGPSLDPAQKRLAVEVEDHPVEYGSFEGTIPQGQYGGGSVLLWDRGRWRPNEPDPAAALRKGRLKFTLDGEKLRGGWILVRMRPIAGENGHKKNWLLIKERDSESRAADPDVLQELPLSVASGRSLEEIGISQKEQPARPTTATAMRSRRTTESASRLRLQSLKGAKRAPLVQTFRPQLPSLAKQPPEGDQWLHEIKLDGYRLLLRIDAGKVAFFTRSGQDWTPRFATLRDAALRLPIKSAIIDGEVVVLAPNGTTSFQALQNALSEGRGGQLVYYVFDLVHLDGFDLARVPLQQRKEILADLVKVPAGNASSIRYSDHLVGDGPELLRQACRLAAEGVVSKRRDAPYRSGRGHDWVKSKCSNRDEFVIGGFTDPKGSRSGFGALLVGYYGDGGRLIYTGRVGTGFTVRSLDDLRVRLVKLEQEKSPFAAVPRQYLERGIHWVKPALVAHVEFANWTGDGVLRHPVFLGLRQDKPPGKVVGERNRDAERPVKKAAKPEKSLPAKLSGVRFTNPDRVLYPSDGITKLELASFYVQIADWILPHLVGRPLSLVRCPEGQQGSCFFQKHAGPGVPDTIARLRIQEKDETKTYLVVEDLAGLVSLVQLGVLEIHQWGARGDRIEQPDRLVFDLDPDPSVAWPGVIAAALETRAVLRELGLESFVKTTGGKGLHVVAPIQRKHDWKEAKQFSKAVADMMVAAAPQRYTANVSKIARRGKIYIDYLRNAREATSVAAYSTRARPGAPVSVPIDWDELTAELRPDQFTVRNLPRRLSSLRSDPWHELTRVRQSITAKMLTKLRAFADRARVARNSSPRGQIPTAANVAPPT